MIKFNFIPRSDIWAVTTLVKRRQLKQISDPRTDNIASAWDSTSYFFLRHANVSAATESRFILQPSASFSLHHAGVWNKHRRM